MYRVKTLAVLTTFVVLTGCGRSEPTPSDETAAIEQWRVERAANLISDNGWLTLAGLYWLKEGDNRFGRASSNQLVLDHPALADIAGIFTLQQGKVSFTAVDSHITHDGQAVTHIDLVPDTAAEPTLLSAGSLRFYAIERAGKFGIRVRDVEHPARKSFQGLTYFPINTEWRVAARFEPYVPSKHIAIVNIQGMTEAMESPGALVFDKDGKTWRLDALLESPTDTELFVMFTDATSGRESYGAGRYLHVPRPSGDTLWMDFNKAYNPPCAFTEFATCPLPPRQNRLSLAVTAGEKKYIGATY